MIMSFEAGGDLYHSMKKHPGQVDWATKTRAMLDVAHGMMYLHDLTPPVMHRDLRSPNVMVRHRAGLAVVAMIVVTATTRVGCTH